MSICPCSLKTFAISLASPTHPAATLSLTRAAAKLHTDLLTTSGAIYKIRKDQREGFELLLTTQDLALADALALPSLTTCEIVQAEAIADEIFEFALRETKTIEQMP